MAIPRPLLIGVLGLALVLVVFIGTGGLRSDDSEKTSADTAAPAADAAAPQGATRVQSGRLTMRLVGRDLVSASKRESLDVKIRAKFQSRGQDALPLIDARGRAVSGESDARFTAISDGENAFARATGTNEGERFSGVTRRIDDKFWLSLGVIRKRLAEAAAGAPQSANGALAVDPVSWLTGVKTVPAKVDGVETQRTTGRIDPRVLTADVRRIAGSFPGGTDDLPSTLERDAARIVRSASVSYDVGTADGILRRARVDLSIRVPKALRNSTDDLESGRFSFTVGLTEVNEPQAVKAPSRSRPAGDVGDDEVAWPYLFLLVGAFAVDAPTGFANVEPRQLLANADAQAPAGVPGGTPAAEGPALKPGPGLPTKVVRALARKDVVVLVFLQDASDDRATREAVDAVKGSPGVTVITDEIGDVSKYRRVLAGLGVNQAPAIVVVRKDGKADLLEGYVDAGTLAQEVADAR